MIVMFWLLLAGYFVKAVIDYWLLLFYYFSANTKRTIAIDSILPQHYLFICPLLFYVGYPPYCILELQKAIGRWVATYHVSIIFEYLIIVVWYSGHSI